jgi:hypothetical protein
LPCGGARPDVSSMATGLIQLRDPVHAALPITSPPNCSMDSSAWDRLSPGIMTCTHVMPTAASGRDVRPPRDQKLPYFVSAAHRFLR